MKPLNIREAPGRASERVRGALPPALSGSTWRTQRIVLNAEGEPVWLTPHLHERFTNRESNIL